MKRSHGQFSTIQQDGGVQQIATPYDDKLAEISARIDNTTVIVDDDGDRLEHRRNMAAAEAALRAEIQKRAELRKAAQDELTTVAKQRDEYLEAQAKGGKDGEGGFDAKVKAAIDAQLK